MSQSPEQALRGLRDALSALAQTLYEAENSPDLVFVKAQAEAAGPSSPAATAVVDRLARLWEEYPRAKDVVERLDEAVAAGRHDEVAELLGPNGVTLADGSTRFVGALIDDLQARAEKVVQEAGRLAGAARAALARLDAAVGRGPEPGGPGRPQSAGPTTSRWRPPPPPWPRPRRPWPPTPPPPHPSPTSTGPWPRPTGGWRSWSGPRPSFPPGAGRGPDGPGRDPAPGGGVGTDAAALARVKIADPAGLLDPLDRSGVDGPVAPTPSAPWLDDIEAAARAGGPAAAAPTSTAGGGRPTGGWPTPAGWPPPTERPSPAATSCGGCCRRSGPSRWPWAGPRTPSWSRLHHRPSRRSTSPPATCGRAEGLVGEYLRAVNATVPGGRR